MPFTKIHIHAIWETKNRSPFLTKEIRCLVINHIFEFAKNKGIFVFRINGYEDHLHCLFSLHYDTSINEMMNLLKGESSYWINKEQLTEEKFEWAEEDYAVSVSESKIQQLISYIDNQEKHHEKNDNFKIKLHNQFAVKKEIQI